LGASASHCSALNIFIWKSSGRSGALVSMPYPRLV
jgi:hypothetical protein